MQHITPRSLKREALALEKALASLQSSPMIYHAPQRVDSVSWIYAEMLRLTVQQIIKDIARLEAKHRAERPAPGIRNLTQPQFLTTNTEPVFVNKDSFVVFGD